MNLKEAMDRSGVLEPSLKEMVGQEMEQMIPLKSLYYPTFVAANQESRADNCLKGSDKHEHLEQIRKDIRYLNYLITRIFIFIVSLKRERV